MTQQKQTAILEYVLVLILGLVLLIFSMRHITALPLNDDGRENLELSFTLAHFSTMGKVTPATLGLPLPQLQVSPSNSREPLPNRLTAWWIRSMPQLMQDPQLYQVQTPRQLKLLKWPNVFMYVGTLLGVYVLLRRLLGELLRTPYQQLLALVGVIICDSCMHPVFITTLLTEFHASCLIVWFTWAWLKSLHTRPWFYSILAGTLLGLLLLTKAAFLYVVAGLAIVIPLWLIWHRYPSVILFQHIMLFAIALLIATAWMWRNHQLFGVWELAERGPTVLLTRAYKSQMTDEEFKGAFYAYAPASLKNTMHQLTGFAETDRLKGGRLQRLSRFSSDFSCSGQSRNDCAVSYYMKANIRYHQLQSQYAAQYPAAPAIARRAADHAAKQLALQMIRDNPWGHLRTSLVFAWRGAWPCNKVDGRWFANERPLMQPAWQEITPFLGLCSMLALAVMAVLKGRLCWLILSITGSCTFVFYALASHFIPRYSEMMIPLWLTALWLVLTMRLLSVLPQRLANKVTAKHNDVTS